MFKSSWLPARIPFTVLTLPLFWLVLSISPNLNEWRSLWVLLITHILLYAAVNLYASFYDAHIRKFNGLTMTRNSPRIRLVIAIAIHAVAVALGLAFVNLPFGILTLVYGLIAYAGGMSGTLSNPVPLTWIIIRISQGLIATLIYYVGLNDLPLENVWQLKLLIPGVTSSLILAAFFPVQQANPNQNAKRIFYQSITLLLIAAGLSVWFFSTYVSAAYNKGVLVGFSCGVLLLFQQYYSIANADRITRYTLWIHWVSTLVLNAYAFYVFTDYTQIFQLVQ